MMAWRRGYCYWCFDTLFMDQQQTIMKTGRTRDVFSKLILGGFLRKTDNVGTIQKQDYW